MQLFYHPHITETTKDILFTKEESRHIVKVLRKQAGANLHTTNGKGLIFTLELTFADPKKSVASVLSVEKKSPLPYSLHLAVAPTKLNERFEWFLEKATEIGVTEITPLLCQRSERKVIKPERFEKIIISAMKQSVKSYKPILHPLTTFQQFITSDSIKTIDLACIAHCEPDDNKKPLKSLLQPKQDLVIMIGPEGDFTPQEIALTTQHNILPVSLGTSRLRTETAALVACHSVAFVNEY